MRAQSRSMSRVLPSKLAGAHSASAQPMRFDAPRLVRKTVVDFSSLSLPEDVRLSLAEAFWSHWDVREQHWIHTRWLSIKTFDRFARESGAIGCLADLRRDLLLRYAEWLNKQCRADARPWAKATRASAYGTLRTLLRWLQRCRPGVISPIEFPPNPFPCRDRDTPLRGTLSPRELRSVLRVCEQEIAQIRATRAAAQRERATADGSLRTLGGLLEHIDRHYGGIAPTNPELLLDGRAPLRRAIYRFGGLKRVQPCLYPRAESLFPYYLAILIHTAGNPQPILELQRDCLQRLPLLEDRQALVWFKRRADSVQRRTFSATDSNEPPALVREILAWNERLVPLADAAIRNRLFLFKAEHGINALSNDTASELLRRFCKRHALPSFSLVCVRPSVLSSFYRASGDLRCASAVANHANIATTVRYVQMPEVQALNRKRIAALQSAFIGHLQQPQATTPARLAATVSNTSLPAGEVVSMFGFGCSDPFAGVAPGTKHGELCTNFMGCFTCPNAIIAPEPATLARLLQAREHLRAASATVHPSRWEVLYAPQLRILEEDILPRFAVQELQAAQALVAKLAPLPDLR